MSAYDLASAALLLAGAAFMLAGTVGLLRFPDVYTRLHALTKVDHVGLGLIALGLAVRADTWATVLQLGIIWLLVLVNSAVTCYLIAHGAFSSARADSAPSAGERVP